MYRKPSATVGAIFVVSLTILLLLLNRDAIVLTWVWQSLGPYVGIIQQMMGYVVIVCLGAFAMRSEGIEWSDLGLSWNNFVLALPLMITLIAGNEVLVYLGGGWAQTFVGPVPSLPLWAISASLIVVALSEEFVFRGFVQIGTSRRFGVTAGVLVSAAVFALVHVPTDLSTLNASMSSAQILYLLIGGIVGRMAFGALAFSYMYQFTGNMYITTFIHAFYDFSVGYLLIFGGTISMILLYIVVPFGIVFTVYYASPFQGLLQRPQVGSGAKT